MGEAVKGRTEEPFRVVPPAKSRAVVDALMKMDKIIIKELENAYASV